MHREHDAGDRTERIRCVDSPDRGLAGAVAQQRAGDERQRHPGAERRRQHHQRGDAAAGQVEERVAGVVFRQAAHQRFHQAESEVVHRQRCERGEAHDHLDPAEQPRRLRARVDSPAHRQAAEGEAENEGREHQLERVRRGAEHEDEHADPDDFVDERRQTGEEGHAEEQSRGRLRAARSPEGGQRLCEQHHRAGDGEIQHARGAQGARQAEPADEEEGAGEHAARGAEAVGEVEHRHRLAGASRHGARDAGAHEREGGAEEERLRQDQQARKRELRRERAAFAADARQEPGVAPVGERDERRVEGEREQPDRRFHRGIDRERAGDPR